MMIPALVLASALAIGAPPADETIIRVDVARVMHRVSPLLYGACIEDVNHEIYGGLYSQLIFGESFQEPPTTRSIAGFSAHGGRWRVLNGELHADAGEGPKLVSDSPTIADGEVGVAIRFPDARDGNAGLILRVDRPGRGADSFTGYEVSLETRGRLVLGRHRGNWEPIRNVPCPVPVDRWIELAVRLAGNTIEIRVDGQVRLTFEDRDHPLGPGRVGLRTWLRPAHYRNLRVEAGGNARAIPFEPAPGDPLAEGVSGMWRPLRRGEARGDLAIDARAPFAGVQSQRITFREGEGELGVENRGLNRWGLNLVAGRPYEGYVWARAEGGPATLTLALESGDGGQVLAESTVEATGLGWSRHDFTLTPLSDARAGRFAVKLKRPGSVSIGHAFLQAGDWGRFKGLPVRKDVAEAMLDQGIPVLRYGGSMVNHPEYRWKRMIGPRDRRPTNAGWWYPHSSNGWGIVDFLDFCEALGIVGIPAFHMGESPQDMADFVEYANGPADTEWGRKRVADGHANPYRLKHVQLGNEEAVDEAYWEKFRAMAEAIWAKDPAIICVVGDFAYARPIVDPYRVEAAASRITTLAAHRKILELARSKGREVWFDIHISTNQPPEPRGLVPERSYIDQLGKLAPGAAYKVVIFEYNSGNHAMKRALSNALANLEAERIGDLLPITCAANALQPDGQNDNGWDQGLLFLNPSKVWLQPPGHLTRMTRRHYQPLLVRSEVLCPSDKFQAGARKSDDGSTLVLQVVNWGDEARTTRIEVEGFIPKKPSATVEQLAGPLEAVNTADDPGRIAPVRSDWAHRMDRDRASYTFPPRSITMIRFD